MEATEEITMQVDKKNCFPLIISTGRMYSNPDDKTETTRAVPNNVRNKRRAFQFISSTIHKTNAPGIEKIRVEINIIKNASGQWPVSFENIDSQVPLSNAFSKAVNTQMVKQVNID